MEKRAVRVFLDSNVILSGLISDKEAPRIILDILSLGLPFINGVTGRYNLIEIERNLKKKAPDVLPAYRHYFLKMILTIAPLPSAEEVRRYAGHLSEKDVPVLVSAIKAKADFLVTGDKKDFGKLKVSGDYPCAIVNPAEFLEAILPAILKGDKAQ
jgi:predicted nucleic acid-binding protein